MNAARLIGWAEAITVGMGELLQARSEAWHPAFATARPHPGQTESARRLRSLAEGANRISPDHAAERRLEPNTTGLVEATAAQDAYTLRCAPQILGAVRDAAAWHESVVTRELNAATDNPIFPGDGASPALHGGNFMGQHVAFASDTLSNAVIALAGFAERQIARVTDERLNGDLPAFLHQGPAGLNSGLMGAQVTATSLLAEMRTRSVPASIQSISTNAANQDVVSMGTIAARSTRAHLRDAARILAIAAIAVAQGADLLAKRGIGVGSSTRRLRDFVRERSEEIIEDRPLSADIDLLAGALSQSDPI